MRKVLPLFMYLLLACACSGNLFDQYEKMEEGTATSDKKKWQPVDCTIDQVTFKSFRISGSVNESVLSDILFVPDDNNNFASLVEHYRLSDDSLIASWDCVAAKVTVNGVEQCPDVTPNDFTKPVRYRLYATDGQYKEFEFSIMQGEYSGLPVALLSTDNELKGKENWVTSLLKISSDGENVSYKTYAKLRGNNSLKYDKKSYTLKLFEKSRILGMNKHKKWVFVANVPDRTLLRNRVAYEIGSRLSLAWTPSTRYCELFVNNEYKGLYLIVEQIKVGKNRVNIKESDDDETPDDANPEDVGFLFEMDTHQDANFFHTAVRELPVNVQYPEKVNETCMTYVRNYFKKIEQYLYQKEVPDPRYRDMLDLGSFADYWIAIELTRCAEAAIPGSVWSYKDAGGKLCAGPIWDFDQNTFNKGSGFLLKDYETTDFNKRERSLYYSRLFKDEEFVRVTKERWMLYRESLYDIVNFIDEQARLIGPTAKANLEMWGTASSANQDTKLSWEDAVALLRSNYLTRWQIIDDEISKW